MYIKLKVYGPGWQKIAVQLACYLDLCLTESGTGFCILVYYTDDFSKVISSPGRFGG